jgi:tellurite resistance protein
MQTMAFFSTLTSPVSREVAALASAVTMMHIDNELTDLERRLIALFRDEFPPLSTLDEATFQASLTRAVEFFTQRNPLADLNAFVRDAIAPAIPNPAERAAVYRLAYGLAMADLYVDDAEATFLTALQTNLGLTPDVCNAQEQASLNEFKGLHRAQAATALGLMVVTADGQVQQDELDHVRSARSVLEPLARMDDTQFALIFDLGLLVHDRYLLDPDNRQGFVASIVNSLLDTPTLRVQAFEYAASVATADGDMATAEIEMLKLVLSSLGLSDAEGEGVFNRYMSRVVTIDGQPRA